MFVRLSACLILFLAILPYDVRADSGARTAFERVGQCFAQGNIQRCHSLLSAGSLSLFDRISNYRAMQCLPKKLTYLSQASENKHTLVRASTQLGGGIRYLRLSFLKEKGGWKLDIPHSLQTALGKNWESQVSLTEQVYQALQQRMGDKLNCTAIENLAMGASPLPAR